MSNTQNDWSTVGNTYNNLNSKWSNTKFNYLEINNDAYTPSTEIVSVGCLCNNDTTSKNLILKQMWNMPDTIINNVINAKKITNQYYWSEKKNISTGNSIGKQVGLSCKTAASDKYVSNNTTSSTFTPNVNYFRDITANKYIADFSEKIPSKTAVDLFGYFVPDSSGEWTFDILPSDGRGIFSNLWISADNAINDYTLNNTDIIHAATNPQKKIHLVQGEYYAIRLQIGNLTGSPTVDKLLTVTSPNGTLITDGSKGHFITLTNSNGSIYYKQLVYFALLQNISSANLFDCYFIKPPDTTNYDIIQTLKTNPPVQIQTKNVPITISYSGNDTVVNDNNTPTNVVLPMGVNITVNSAKWGILTPAKSYYYVPLTVPITVTAQGSIGSVVGEAGTSESGHNVNYKKHAYDYPSTRIDQQKTYKTVDASKDVTTEASKFINSNILSVKSPYTSVFGDPTSGYAFDSVYPLQLKLNYSYNGVVDQTSISAPFIYLNNYGKVKIGYTYNGIKFESDFNFDKTYNQCSAICTYQLVLDDDGKFCIYNGNTLITSKDIPSLLKINLAECFPNPDWVDNPNRVSSLVVNQRLGSGGANKLTSSNGKFVMYFEGNQLTFKYCINPNKSFVSDSFANGAYNMHYTTSKNTDQYGYQLYFLYRMDTRGISGHRYMSRSTATSNDLFYVPEYPSSNNILKFDKFESQNNLYPLTYPMDNNPNYTIINQDVTDDSVCKKSCINSPTCDHYFYVTDTKNNNYCFLDNQNILNPIYTNTPITNISHSTYNKKAYQLNTTCGDLPNKPIPKVTNDVMNDTPLRYDDLAKNAPNLTYYCGMEGYKMANSTVHNIYDKQGFSNMENFTSNDAQFYKDTPYKINDLSNINYLKGMSNTYSNLQNSIAVNNMNINNTIHKYVDLSNNLGSDIKYKLNGADAIIPEKYVQHLSAKPENTFQDGVKRDLDIINTQQNALYTIAAISTATLIIMTLFIIK